MRVLITGATGFLGGALILRLVRDGLAVRALVRRGQNVRALQGPDVELASGDVRELAFVRDAMRGCSHVIHLAAATAAGVSASECHAVNVRGTRNLADAARAEGIARFVYGSTLGVYGFVSGGTLDESSPIRPNTPYRASKWLGEAVLWEAHRRVGLPIVIARISTVVGPGAKRLLPLARAIDAGRFRLIGDGANHVDLVALDDLVDGLCKCATVPRADGCYVLGSSEERTVRTFAAAVARALDKPGPGGGPPAAPYRVVMRLASLAFRTTGYHSAFAHRREMLVADKRASSARARIELGYDPRQPLDAAINEMIAQFIAEGWLRPSGAD